MPGWAGPALLGAGALLSLGFVVAGITRLGGSALRLQKRLETFQDLPIEAAFARTSARVDATAARIAAVPILLIRAKVALETLDASRRRLTQVATSATGIINIARLLFAPTSKN
jgi:hypothetical protein